MHACMCLYWPVSRYSQSGGLPSVLQPVRVECTACVHYGLPVLQSCSLCPYSNISLIKSSSQAG